MVVARRVYLYAIAFAALWVLTDGIAGLLAVGIEVLAEAMLGPGLTVGPSDVADRVSFFGALTGLGLVIWSIHWWLAARAVSRDPRGERRSAIRKLYLYGVLLVGGLILLFQLRTLLTDLFGIVFGIVGRSDLLTGDVIAPLAMLAATGAFLLYHARQVQRDRLVVPEVGAAATIRRWCVYLLALAGLLMLLFGMAGLLARLLDLAVPVEGAIADSGRWLAYEVADRLGAVLAGLTVWLVAWRWSSRSADWDRGPDPERASVLRRVYLYGVLLIAVSWTVWSVSQVLYVVLRSLLIPSEAGALWLFVQSELGERAANLLVFGVAWAYHASVPRHEAAAAPEHHQQATIRWIYGYIVAFVGAATLAAGLVGTLMTVLDLLFTPSILHDEHWWQEQLALYGTMIVVGLPVWLLPWLSLQREVSVAVARRSLARRVYLLLVLGITVLTLLGSGAYALYQILRVALGERWDLSNTMSMIDAGSVAAVAALLLAYHLRVFQRDAVLARQDEAPTPAGQRVPPPIDGTSGLAVDARTVTLVVARAGGADDAAALRARLAAMLPPGTKIETITLTEAEAERLLGST